MDETWVVSQAEKGVTTLTLNRPKYRNALTLSMYQTLTTALTQASQDPLTKVVVLAGLPHIFCAGNDISDFVKNPPLNPDAPVLQFLNALASFPKPLVAAPCGAAVGVGTTLLFHCELIFAGDNAQFSMPFAQLGLCPEAASGYLAPRLLGYPRAAQALLLGDPISASQALQWGLVNAVQPPGETLARAQEAAARMAQLPLQVLLETKSLLKKAMETPTKDQMEREAKSFASLLKAPPAQEAFLAFQEKRTPDFSKF